MIAPRLPVVPLGTPDAPPEPSRYVSRSPGALLLQVRTAVLVLAWVLTLLQLAGGDSGELAALASFPIAAALAFLADRRYLGAMLVLCIPALGLPDTVAPGGAAADGAGGFIIAFPDAVTFVVLGGVQVTSVLVILAAGFGRVMLEVLRRPSTFRGVCPPLAVLAYAAALIPALMCALQGQANGLNRWSVGVRGLLAVGGFFWGVVMVRQSRGTPSDYARQVLRVVLVGSFLAVIGILRGTYFFLLVGMTGGAFAHYLSRRRGLPATLTGAVVVGSVFVATLTTLGEVAFALLCMMLNGPGMRRLRRFLVRAGVATAGIMSLGLLWAVMRFSQMASFTANSRDQGLLAYAYFKLMGDRGPLWVSALEQILAGPYVIVPAGRPLHPQGIYARLYSWEFGAHNTVLELLINNGMVAGAAGVALIGLAIWSAARLLIDTQDRGLRAVAAGFLGVGVVGVTTGSFPVYDVGFFLWSLGGILAALHAAELARREAELASAGTPPAAPASRLPAFA
ncbi:MAG TPA: hypothetical protein VFJ16_25015 [Longimicrobium sp.]|nr:hypothetical protein [Longimicrobium sp.]